MNQTCREINVTNRLTNDMDWFNMHTGHGTAVQHKRAKYLSRKQMNANVELRAICMDFL